MYLRTICSTFSRFVVPSDAALCQAYYSMFALILQVGTCRALHSKCHPRHFFTPESTFAKFVVPSDAALCLRAQFPRKYVRKMLDILLAFGKPVAKNDARVIRRRLPPLSPLTHEFRGGPILSRTFLTNRLRLLNQPLCHSYVSKLSTSSREYFLLYFEGTELVHFAHEPTS